MKMIKKINYILKFIFQLLLECVSKSNHLPRFLLAIHRAGVSPGRTPNKFPISGQAYGVSDDHTSDQAFFTILYQPLVPFAAHTHAVRCLTAMYPATV